jgi:hypothetical protein
MRAAYGSQEGENKGSSVREANTKLSAGAELGSDLSASFKIRQLTDVLHCNLQNHFICNRH